MRFLFLFLILSLLHLSHAQPPRRDGRDRRELDPIQPGDPKLNKRKGQPCNQRYRELNGVCTNDSGPQRQLWGSTNRPQSTYFSGRSTTTFRDTGVRSARAISDILFKQDKNVFDERNLSELAVFIGQFIDHTLVATPTSKSDEESVDIEIPGGGKLGKFTGFLPFKRSERVRVKLRDNSEFPENTLSSALDLTSVYGGSKQRNTALRVGTDGMMKLSDGDFPPLNTNFNNAPRLGSEFFLCGDHRSNEHPILTSLHTIFLREHNAIARDLKRRNRSWNDETLFDEAKKINEGQWQKIAFEEWFPAVTGRYLPRYTGFKKTVDPTISVTFSTAAFRVGHTMVGNTVKRFGPGNVKKKPIDLLAAFFPGAEFMRSKGVDDFIRGAANSVAQKVDNLVVDGLRNGLFKNIEGEEENFDLISLNIQRGRDHNLPSYNGLRVRFGIPKATTFQHISSNGQTRARLQSAYMNDVNKVEAFPGMLSEDLAANSSLGPLLLRIWEREFTRIRDGDRFYFRNRGAFTERDRARNPRVRALFTNEDILRRIIVSNTDIADADLPEQIFFAT